MIVTKRINHLDTLTLVRAADQLVADYTEATGNPSSSAGVLLSTIALAADNIPAMKTTRIVIDTHGYSIEYDANTITEAHVLDNLRRAMSIVEEDILSE